MPSRAYATRRPDDWPPGCWRRTPDWLTPLPGFGQGLLVKGALGGGECHRHAVHAITQPVGGGRRRTHGPDGRRSAQCTSVRIAQIMVGAGATAPGKGFQKLGQPVLSNFVREGTAAAIGRAGEGAARCSFSSGEV
jgi:hypothetical protein